jgi:hypothetical protein
VEGEPVHHALERHRPAQRPLEAGDPAPADAAGDDQLEGREVGADVEREAVRGDPAGDADPDRADLVLGQPGAGQARNACRREAVVAARPDHHLLEVADVTVHVAPSWRKLEDRVADHLPGAVVGDVAAAASLEHLEAARAQRLGWEQDVLAARVAAEREDGVVLEQQQLVGHAPGLPLGHQLGLQLEPPRIRNAAEPAHEQRACERPLRFVWQFGT